MNPWNHETFVLKNLETFHPRILGYLEPHNSNSLEILKHPKPETWNLKTLTPWNHEIWILRNLETSNPSIIGQIDDVDYIDSDDNIDSEDNIDNKVFSGNFRTFLMP
jgi:hypothetical protein